MADDDAVKEAAKLPIDERATHANWKVRSAAFEDIKKGVERVFNDDDPVLLEYGERRINRSRRPWSRQHRHGPCSHG
jgi:hypothetical protein